MKKLLALIFAGMFAVASASAVIAAEKKEAAKVDCKDKKNKDNKDCKKKK
jgi:Spy/CpxP family protein refolding chaperone